MKNKDFAYILIVLGGLDLLIWISNGFSHGYLEYIVGVNLLSEYGAWIMIASGFYLLKKEKGKENSEIDLINELNEGEEIIFKSIGNRTIITLTNKKIIFRAFDDLSDLIQHHNNIINVDKIIYDYALISSSKTILTKETAKHTIAGILNINLGIQLQFKDGTFINLPMSSNCDLICAHINKQVN